MPLHCCVYEQAKKNNIFFYFFLYRSLCGTVLQAFVSIPFRLLNISKFLCKIQPQKDEDVNLGTYDRENKRENDRYIDYILFINQYIYIYIYL